MNRDVMKSAFLLRYEADSFQFSRWCCKISGTAVVSYALWRSL